MVTDPRPSPGGAPSASAAGPPPARLPQEVAERLAALERAAGRRLGRADRPLLVSVAARSATPGPVGPVVGIGLNDHSVLGLAWRTGSERSAWAAYLRLVRSFGSTVLGVAPERFSAAVARVEERLGVPEGGQLDTCGLIQAVVVCKDLMAEECGEELPHDPAEQLRRAVAAVLAATGWEPRPGHGVTDAVSVRRTVIAEAGPVPGTVSTEPRGRTCVNTR